jgi:D-alanine-D-alanine ligase
VRVAVLAGGRSSEHDVSLSSGASVREGLAAAGHEVVAVDIGRDGVWRVGGDEVAVTPGRGLLGADVAFPVLHGPYGEDGTVQGLLESAGVPYVGSGVAASAVCMDKLLLKDLMARAGVAQVAYARAERGAGLPAGIGLPCWVKPARLGSSVGIVRVDDADAFPAAVETALAHDPRVIVEAHAEGLEVECSVLGHTERPEASVPGEIVLRKGAGWYDFEAKYAEGGMELVVPARISEEATAAVRELAARAFRLAGCSGLARVDFFVADGGAVLLNELNTMPGFTSTSVYAKLFEASGVAYAELVDRLCRIAVERAESERAYAF